MVVNLSYSQGAKSISVFDEASKVYLTTHVVGILENYGGTDINSYQRFINNYSQFEDANNKTDFNTFIGNLCSGLNSIGLKDTDFENLVSNNFEALDKFKDLGNPGAHRIYPDFSWIKNTLISRENQYQLASIILDPKKSKRSIRKTERILIEHYEDFSDLKGDSSIIYTTGLIHFWNKVLFYFPYIKLMDKDWKDVLYDNFDLFINIRSKEQYYHRLELLAAYLDDSHGKVFVPSIWRSSTNTGVWQSFPVAVELLNSQLIVSHIADKPELKGLSIGDTITQINSTNQKAYLDEISSKIIASNETDSTKALAEKLMGQYPLTIGDSTLLLRVNDNDFLVRSEPIHDSVFNKYLQREFKPAALESPIQSIDSSIAYINLVVLDGKTVHRGFKNYRNKEYLILDLRGYPPNSLGVFLARNLSKKAKPVVSLYHPEYHFPGFFSKFGKTMKYYFSNYLDFLFWTLNLGKGKTMPTLRKPYEGQLVVLINEHAISWSETIAMIIKTYHPNVTFIGRPTNGANGDVTRFPLPYNVSVSMSGLYWEYASGEQLQRIGIVPDVLIDLSYDEVINREDIILKEAIDWIKNR